MADINPAPPIDHVVLGLGRVLKQYQNSPKLLAFLKALLTMNNTVEALLQSMYQLPNIDTMAGVNLDVIGRIVGITRNIPNGIQLVFFGFSGQSNQTVFGELGNPGIGSRFYEIGEPTASTSTLGDLEYRLLLKAKIINNSSKATGPQIEALMAFLFSSSAVNVDDYGNMTIGLAIGRHLTQIEQALLTQIDLLPRPACVQVVSVTSYDASNYFGFSELSGVYNQPGAKPFGELGNPAVGGILAELFVPMI